MFEGPVLALEGQVQDQLGRQDHLHNQECSKASCTRTSPRQSMCPPAQTTKISAEIIFLVISITFLYHLTSLKPSMAHLALAEGIFTRALQYDLYIGHWYRHIIFAWALQYIPYMDSRT